ncbi:LacI family DNA-binding transcriptional regulator [Terrabacter sp. Ter38]|uniref:LacI family DNA-binding transcriptional regulator n=1 Tax=Terrabacter sp. Ter38 TaxID=2926030 RepID=UPI002117E495|nr:LacI family DNA-binding transcriptional regulator [Terrabacter sp. Ter38]
MTGQNRPSDAAPDARDHLHGDRMGDALSDAATDPVEKAATPGTSKKRSARPSRARSGAGARRVTLAQVAEVAGVSRSAASFVLTGRTDQRISDETQARVRSAAAALGYRPDVTSQILRTGQSGTIALVSEFVASTPYANRIIGAALDQARKHDTVMFIAETLGEKDTEERLLQNLVDRRVDGFIYASMFTQAVTIPDVLRGIPLVLLNCCAPDDRVPMVIPDEVEAGRAAAQTLLQHGHGEGIHYIGGPTLDFRGGPEWGGRVGTAVHDRLAGVKQELAHAGQALAGISETDNWEPQNGREAVATILAQGRAPTALICANDRLAFGAYQALAAAGLRIPEDVSLVSFDHSDLAGWLQPSLSSIALPHEEMGALAVDLLMSEKPRTGKHAIRMTLHQGNSISAPHPS